MPPTHATIAHLSGLARREVVARRIARWYVHEWGGPDPEPETAVAGLVDELCRDTTGDGLPSTWTAEMGGYLAGAAQLKRREVPALDAFEYWLGGVYVDAAFRRRGVARMLVERCAAEAIDRGIRRLYLQTEVHNVGLYARLGWVPAELPPGIVHERPVMVRALFA